MHEPKPSRNLRIASGRFLAGKNSADQMTEILSRSRKKLWGRIDSAAYVESNPFLFGFLDVLGSVFPGAKIVHVTRDPRTSVRSVLNFGSHHGLKGLLLEWIPYWTVRPEDLEAVPAKKWRDMSPLERSAWFWQVVNGNLRRGSDLYGENYRQFRYEDLFRTDGSGLRELAVWLGLEERGSAFTDLLRERHNASSDSRSALWEHWSEQDQAILLEHCGELMTEFGYEV